MEILVLAGPTASGKSRLALELAERHDAHIVSADAMTVYRGLDIGTAKPSAEERGRVVHHAIDVRDPDGDFSVSDFLETIRLAGAAHPRLIVAGGTLFYLRALLQPLADLPAADPSLRAELEATEDLHGLLVEVDPPTAARLHPNDRIRLVRALEVHRLTGVAMSELHARGSSTPAPDHPLIWLDDEDLRPRIDARLQQMVEDGVIDEAKAALEAGWDPGLKPLQSFAYRHFLAHIAGEVDREEAIRCTARDTWRFARKQRTWKRNMGWQTSSTIAAHDIAQGIFAP
jgi:tRNA dimethylallyltransferase